MPSVLDTRRLARALMGPDEPERPVVDRFSMLPIGQHADGSLTLAWPGFVKDAYNSIVNSYSDVAQGRTPKTGDLLTVASTPVMGNLAGNAVGRLARTAAAVDESAARASPSAISAEPVEAAARWEARLSPDERFIAEARAQGRWPEWGDQHPERALASLRESAAADAWNAAIRPFMYPDGFKAMERWQAEAEAMKTHPELGQAYQEARRAWLEQDKGRPLTPGELVWESLDRPPGAPPATPAELMNTYGREKFMVAGHPDIGAARVDGSRKTNLLSANAPEGSLLPLGLQALEQSQPKGIRAFHGSPHDFDRFDMSKIGTGEGAQAYGHGLYFAENEAVARGYRDDLTAAVDTPDMRAAKILEMHGGDNQKATDYLARRVDDAYGSRDMDRAEQLLRSKAALASPDTLPKTSGRMYEVRINAEPEQFLDWDKPLSQQSETVQKALRNAHGDLTTMLPDNVVQGKNGRWFTRNGDVVLGRYEGWPDKSTAEEAMKVLREQAIANKTAGEWYHQMNSPIFNSEKLREAGIPGIRYLDQGSRGTGEGTSNFVVFDDALIDILRKYGLLGMVGGGAALAGSGTDAQAASRP